MKYTSLSLRSALPSGETHYSSENGALITRYDHGFIVTKDGVVYWTPDTNVTATLVTMV